MNDSIKEYVIDGDEIKDLPTFYKVFGEAVNGPNGYFGRDLFAFDDCLFGGFGLANPCVIRFKSVHLINAKLGHEAQQAYLEEVVHERHFPDEDVLENFRLGSEEAKRGLGPTMFESVLSCLTSVYERSGGKVQITVILEP